MNFLSTEPLYAFTQQVAASAILGRAKARLCMAHHETNRGYAPFAPSSLHHAHGLATDYAFPRGFRKDPCVVVDFQERLAYTPPPASVVEEHVVDLVRGLNRLERLTDAEVLMHAAQLHLAILCIHPFPDGNGRTARIMERIFIKHHRGDWGMKIRTEAYYRTHRATYFSNLQAIGPNWNSLRMDRTLPFLQMLPAAIIHQLNS